VTRFGIAGLALLAAVPALGQAGQAMLSRLEAGQWELRGPNNARIAAICLGNPIQLTQPYHRGVNCTREVVAADAHGMTVSYSCPGIGRGRTQIRFETPRLIQIESQGLDRGAPFSVRAVARRIGPC
jgi:hypothetical protein